MTALEEIKKAIAKSIDEGLLDFTDEECDVESEVHGFITKIIDAVSPTLESLQRDNEELRNLDYRLKQEAQIHAMEARSANSTINEIYQIISGGKGEPANYHGAEPVRKYVEAVKGEILRLETELALSKPVYSRRQLEARAEAAEAEVKRLHVITEPFLREAKRLGLSSLCPDTERLTVIVTAKEMRGALSAYKKGASNADANQAIAAVEALLSIDDTAEYQQGIIDAVSAIRALASTGGEHNAE